MPTNFGRLFWALTVCAVCSSCAPSRPPSAPENAVHTGTILEPGVWVVCGQWSAGVSAPCEKFGFELDEKGTYVLVEAGNEPRSAGPNADVVGSLRAIGFLDGVYVSQYNLRMRPVSHVQRRGGVVVGGFHTFDDCMGRSVASVIELINQSNKFSDRSLQVIALASKIFGSQKWVIRRSTQLGALGEYDLVGERSGEVIVSLLPQCVGRAQKSGIAVGL